MKDRRRFKTAFILGAGPGMRLRPLTERCPKPLLEVGGRPVITYAMDHLAGVGVDRFIVNTHHRAEVYAEKFPDQHYRHVPIAFRHEPVLLDTGGGLKNIDDLIAGDEAIFCYNGDIIADFPLQDLKRFHDQNRPEATLALRSDGPLLNVEVNEDGAICDLRHALNAPGTKTCAFTGIYAIETSILHYMQAGAVRSIIDTFLDRIREKPGSIMGVILDQGNWQDIGDLSAFERLNSTPRQERADEIKG
jgi:mannose-1-phosphate guanylyltransferase